MKSPTLTDYEKAQMEDLIEETLLMNFLTLVEKALHGDPAATKLHQRLKQDEKHASSGETDLGTVPD